MLHATAHGTVITLSLLLLRICRVYLSRLRGLCSGCGRTADTGSIAFSTLLALCCSRGWFFGFGGLWFIIVRLFLLRPLFVHFCLCRILLSCCGIILAPQFTSHKGHVVNSKFLFS